MAENESGAAPESQPKQPKKSGGFRRFQDWWYREFRRIIGAWVFVLVILFIAVLSLTTLDFTDYIFSRMTFCGNVCHVMESTVYQELKKSKHWNTWTGVRPTCARCHVAGRLTYAMVDHFLGTGELFVNFTNDFSKPGSFEKFRPDAANRERFKMLANDSAGCRSCHVMEAIKPRRVRGQNAHKDAMERGITCIVCHYNLVHKPVDPSQAFLNAISAILNAPAAGEESKPASENAHEPGADYDSGDEVL